MTACAKQPCSRPPTRRGMCNAHYEWHRTRQLAYGRWESVYVDAEPARLHLKSLQAAGLGTRRIAALAGVNRKTLQYLTAGRPDRGTPPSHQITADNAARILAVEVPEVAHRAAADHQLVDATGTVRRLQALVAYGYPRVALMARIGVQQSNGVHLFDTDTRHVLAVTARKVESMFAELQLVPGPSSRARGDGRRRGWPVPLQWDEDTIDDPYAEPDLAPAPTVSFADRFEELVDLGYTDDVSIGRKLGIAPESVERQRLRYGLQVAS